MDVHTLNRHGQNVKFCSTAPGFRHGQDESRPFMTVKISSHLAQFVWSIAWPPSTSSMCMFARNVSVLLGFGANIVMPALLDGITASDMRNSQPAAISQAYVRFREEIAHIDESMPRTITSTSDSENVKARRGDKVRASVWNGVRYIRVLTN
ncbi:hypothetical protein M440DRAFT_350325 [Trichoderma longibrachiatum ATCC 18648]|uniref:Uncharacterized protein n=1 Tax=Trichoderma longibrachiatum ATCC 18648 TaxID=983965 RepID=A0A2T4BR47_TRILO|nr:hypothetical protein M440DRAFT_350325 [Trichoderma longibrachiatum ATCC 18648]